MLHPELLSLRQATADLFFHRRHSNTQRQVWLSLCGVSWCAQGFVWALWVSLVSMVFDSKCDFTLPTILLGFLLCPWTWGIFFSGIQHSVDGFSAAVCSFGVLAREDECISFYSALYKLLSKLGILGIFLTLINIICKNTTANIISSEWWNVNIPAFVIRKKAMRAAITTFFQHCPRGPGQ